jgi:hypothetical protein
MLLRFQIVLMRAHNLGLTTITSLWFFLEHGQPTGSHKERLISMGSDMQSPAISAKVYGSFMNYAGGRTSLTISDKFRITLVVAFCCADIFAG